MIKQIVTVLVGVCGLHCSADQSHLLLFESGKEGYPRYRIPSLVVTGKGTVIAICEGRKDGGGLTGNIDLVSKRSFDHGESWTGLSRVADAGPDTLGNASALVDATTGVIWIAGTISPGEFLERDIARGTSKESNRVFIASSSDDGKTWSEPRDITSAVKKAGWTWYGCGPGVGIQLRSGRLFFPCYHREGENGSIVRSHGIFSDDHGATWQLGGNAGTGNGEPQALQREDDSLYLSARTAGSGPHFRSIVESRDQGTTWNEKRYDEQIYDSHCQASLLALTPEEGKPRWLYCSPAGPKRNNLTIRLSRDEGETWNSGSMILRKGNGHYSSMSALPDGRVAIFYDLWEKGNYQLYFTTVSPGEIR